VCSDATDGENPDWGALEQPVKTEKAKIAIAELITFLIVLQSLSGCNVNCTL
jgi:hypothetical protein